MRGSILGAIALTVLATASATAFAYGPTSRCPWGARCSTDRDCITDREQAFNTYRKDVADNVCYSPKLLDGGEVYYTCVEGTGDYPSRNRIGKYWSYSERAYSHYTGPACEKLWGHPNGPTSVWTHLTNNRTLSTCARMYRCEPYYGRGSDH